MAYFNAFQLTILMIASPSIIYWLSEATFKGSSVAFWVAIITTVVGVGFNTVQLGIRFDERLK